jgi:hypothetical protein
MTPFQPLDDNTMFQATYCWIHEEDVSNTRSLRTAVGNWRWEDVGSVQTLDPEQFKELQGPRCAVQAQGGWIYLRADYATVLAAWRAWRRKYTGYFLTFTQMN